MVSYFHLMIVSNLPFDPQAAVAGRIRRIGALGDDALERHGAGFLVKRPAMADLLIAVLESGAHIRRGDAVGTRRRQRSGKALA